MFRYPVYYISMKRLCTRNTQVILALILSAQRIYQNAPHLQWSNTTAFVVNAVRVVHEGTPLVRKRR